MKVLINVWTAVTLPVDSDANIRLKNYIYSISFMKELITVFRLQLTVVFPDELISCLV